MKLIREGTFETNSSSTHALVIPKVVSEEEYSTYDSLDHNYEFGREECRLVNDWDEKLAYIYLILKEAVDRKLIITKDLDGFKETIKWLYTEVAKDRNESYRVTPKNIFDNIDKGSQVDECAYSDYHYYPYVDHMEDLLNKEFINRLLNDIEFLKRFIFNRQSYITVGGDEYRGYNIKTIGFEEDYNYEYTEDCDVVGEFWDKLKEYKKENDVYLKGN